MIVNEILYTHDFIRQLKKLPKNIQLLAIAKEKIFKVNPLHPSLRLHTLTGKLAGLFSISLNMSYRILFKRKGNGDIVFLTIGKHDIYKNL